MYLEQPFILCAGLSRDEPKKKINTIIKGAGDGIFTTRKQLEKGQLDVWVNIRFGINIRVCIPRIYFKSKFKSERLWLELAAAVPCLISIWVRIWPAFQFPTQISACFQQQISFQINSFLSFTWVGKHTMEKWANISISDPSRWMSEWCLMYRH